MYYSGVERLEQLVDRYLVHGDEAAIGTVVRLTRGRLLRAARRIAAADAEDCVQTAYLSLVHKRGAALAAPVWPWLITAVVRTAYRYRAQGARRAEIARQLARPRESRDPVQSAAEAEEASILRQAVARLPDKLRDALVLRDLEGLSTRETALLLGITEANVRVRVQRARTVLRTRMPPRVACAMFALPWFVADLSAKGNARQAASASLAAAALLGVGLLVTIARRPQQSTAHVPVRAAATVADEGGGGLGASSGKATRPVPAAPGVVLTGHVVDPDGAPVRDALVVSSPMNNPRPLRPGQTVAPARSTRTDANGRFEVALDGRTYAWSLYAEAPGFSPILQRDLPSARAPVIRLRPAATMAGQVMNLAGQPISGATVRWHCFWEGVALERKATSGADGRYRLKGLPAPGTFRQRGGEGDTGVMVSAAGYAPVTVPVSTGDHNFVLTKGATVHGVVLDDTSGRPVAGALVRLRSTHFARHFEVPHKGRMPDPVGTRLLGESRSGVDGSFRLFHVPSAGFHNQTRQERCVLAATAAGQTSRPVPVPAAWPGEQKHVELRLVRAVAVHGVVVDGHGSPLRGARIEVLGRAASSGPDGSFRIDGLPAPALAELRVTAEPQVQAEWRAARISTRLRPNGNDVWDAGTLVLRQRAEPAAEFVVVDASGAPVPGAAVGTRAEGFSRADRAGRLRMMFSGSDPVRRVVLAPGHAPVVTAPFSPAVHDPPIVRVVLRAGHTLSGTVRWQDNKPARDALFYVYNGAVSLAAAKSALRTSTRRKGLPPLVVYATGRTDGQGRFEILNLPPPPYHATASHQTFLSEPVVSEAVHPASGVTLTLPGPRPTVTNCAVTGTLRDAETGARVTLFRAYVRRAGPPYPVRSTAPGEWSPPPLGAGEYRYSIMARGYMPHDGKFKVQPGQAQLRVAVELVRGATVRGVVTGAPLGARVRLIDESWAHAEASVGPDGTFSVRHVRPGRHVAEVYVERGGRFLRLALRGVPQGTLGVHDREAVLNLNVVPGGAADFVVARRRLPEGASLAIEDIERKLVGGAGAWALDRAIGWSHRGWSKWSLPAGSYVARFVCPGQETIERKFEIVANQNVTIELGEQK